MSGGMSLSYAEMDAVIVQDQDGAPRRVMMRTMSTLWPSFKPNPALSSIYAVANSSAQQRWALRDFLII